MEKLFTKFFTDYKDALNDKRRFVGLVKDLMPGQPMQANLFINLYEIGLYSEIEAAQSITNTFAYRFVKRLCDEYGVSRMNADWAVATWCICYGKNVLKKPCELSGLNVKPNNAANPIIKEEKSGKALYKDLFRFTKDFNGEYVAQEFLDKSQRTLVVSAEYQKQPVTAIGAEAFKDLDIEDAVIMDGIREIGASAFSHCGKLRRVILPQTLLSISNNAFADCALLGGLSLPLTLQHIGKNAFSGCARLKEVVIPKGVTFIGLDAFDAETVKIVVSRGSYAESYAKENLTPYKYDKLED